MHSHEKIITKSAPWSEMIFYSYTLRYSCFGVTTLDIPSFHKKNILSNSESSTVLDFQYQSPDGRKDLKQSFLDHFPVISQFKEAGIKLDDSNVLVSHGAIYTLVSSVDAFVEAGEEVIMLEPIYVHHTARIGKRTDIVLKTCKMVYKEESKRFEFDIEAFKGILGQKSRLLIFTNPGNPSTRSFSKEEF
jgi:aspartate/methionine/tyrosine aminotransferase